MLELESMSTDVLVIGSGIAGMWAAMEARRAGARVTVVTRGRFGKNASTAMARTFRTYHGDEAGGRDIPGYDDGPGRYIEDMPLVRAIIAEAEDRIQDLIKLGVPMVHKPGVGRFEKTPLWYVEGGEQAHGGAIVLDVLAPKAREMGVKVVERCQATSLVRRGDRIVGASGLLGDGRWLSVRARAVILATGGAAGMAEVASAPPEISGNGYAMALRAGVTLRNIEFNQFYPVGLPTPSGQWVHCAPLTLMMEGALLRNDRGEDIIRKHFGISVQQGTSISSIRFDWLPRAVALEMERGKVWLDLTAVPAAEWDRLPERNWKQIRRTQVDMKTTPVSVKHMSHAWRGGIVVTPQLRTTAPGLYAAGEVAAGWVARWRGMGNLPSCLTMGAIAARSAINDIQGVRAPSGRLADERLREAQALASRKGTVSPAGLDGEIRRAMYAHAGPVKGGASLEEGLRKLQELKDRATAMKCDSPEGLGRALEARAMLLAAEAVLGAALLRTESRGGFYRRDFPARNDEGWLRPVLVSYDAEKEEMRVEKGERVTY